MAAPPVPSVPSTAGKAFWRVILVIVLIVLAAVAVYVLFYTDVGVRLRANPRKLRPEFRQWVESHAWFAPGAFVLIFVAASLCLLPVWWLQILAGYGFGLWLGV